SRIRQGPTGGERPARRRIAGPPGARGTAAPAGRRRTTARSASTEELSMATYYFAYGADIDSEQLDLQQDRRRRRRMNFARSAPAVLEGYRLVCDIASKSWRGTIFNVLPDPTAAVH